MRNKIFKNDEAFQGQLSMMVTTSNGQYHQQLQYQTKDKRIAVTDTTSKDTIPCRFDSFSLVFLRGEQLLQRAKKAKKNIWRSHG